MSRFHYAEAVSSSACACQARARRVSTPDEVGEHGDAHSVPRVQLLPQRQQLRAIARRQRQVVAMLRKEHGELAPDAPEAPVINTVCTRDSCSRMLPLASHEYTAVLRRGKCG